MLGDSSTRVWGRLAILLIVGSAILRWIYLAGACPLDLSPDEAHYWDWSRHLDWSYYSKGPLVAYLIHAADSLLGPLTRLWTGAAAGAVRFPAVVCGALLLASLYVLTVQVYRRASLGFATVVVALTLPMVNVGASLITIDAPYTCCWGWALVLAYEAIWRRRSWAWPTLGVVIGLGVLAKYTMVLFLPSLILVLLADKFIRPQLVQRGFWIMVLTMAVCCLPIAVWNARHDWVTVRHVLGQAGVSGQGRLQWVGPLEYVGTQAALLLVFWFVAWIRALAATCPWRQTEPGIHYLWWMSVPTFVIFLLFSARTHVEPNWPVTAYLSGLVLTVGWLQGEFASRRLWYRRLAWSALLTTLAVGIGLSLWTYDARPIRPMLAWLSGPPSAQHPLPMRRVDPTCRLRGWRTLAHAVDQMRVEERSHGVEPILAATSWTVPGELGFYCAEHPDVYSLGLALGDRHSQYDLWHPNPVDNPDFFRGRTFIVVGDCSERLRQAFEGCRRSRTVMFAEDGYTLATWTVTVLDGYRGLDVKPSSF